MSDKRTLADMGERGWLSLLLEALDMTDENLLVPIGDDAAVRKTTPGKAEILTSDVMVEGTHFDRSWLDWAGLPRRALVAAASDIAAMGGVPKGFLLSLGLPPETPTEGLERFVDSLARFCKQTRLTPLGGDTARSERIFLDVTVLGEVAPSEWWGQTGAQPGDTIWVTGTLGGSRVFWESGPGTSVPGARERFWSPPTRWHCCADLRSTLDIRAATDLSDGLAADLRKILQQGAIGARIELDQIPVDPVAESHCEEKNRDSKEFAFLGGEDFELLLIEKGSSVPHKPFVIQGVPVTRIGTITAKKGTVECLRSDHPVEISCTSFSHFIRNAP